MGILTCTKFSKVQAVKQKWRDIMTEAKIEVVFEKNTIAAKNIVAETVVAPFSPRAT